MDWWRESNGENFSRDFWPQWLFELSEKYESNDSNLGNLLIKVDIVPISLALALKLQLRVVGEPLDIQGKGMQFMDSTLMMKKGIKTIEKRCK